MTLVIGLLLLAGLLGACTLPKGGGTCRFEDLVPPTNLSPNDLDTPLENLTPTLSWQYTAGCNPENFRVEVFATGWAYPVHSYRAEIDGSSRSLTVGPLQPGTFYEWSVTPISDLREGEKEAAMFVTGPACSSADRRAYTPPTLLSPFDGQVISSISEGTRGGTTWRSPMIIFAWENSMTCLPTEGYTVQLSRDRDFTHYDPIVRGSFFSESRTSTPWFFPPEIEWHDCDRIFWRVLIGSLDGDVYATSVAWSFIINTSGGVCPPDLGVILTPIPFSDLPLGPTIPTARLNQAANCRSGPGMDYPVADILPQGLSLPINGRNQQGSWWQVLDPQIQRNCWLAGNVIDLSGETGDVPVIAVAPPAPTDTPVPGPGAFNCAQFNKNQQACIKNSHCTWDSNRSPNSPCVNKP